MGISMKITFARDWEERPNVGVQFLVTGQNRLWNIGTESRPAG